jgi:PAS domain S-box-containing protein
MKGANAINLPTPLGGNAATSFLTQGGDERSLVMAATSLFGCSATAIAVCRAGASADDARVVWVNAAFERLSGYTAAQVTGRSAILLAGAHVDRIHLSEVELLRDHPEQMPFGIVVTKQRPDGRWYDVEERLFVIRGMGGEPTHFLLAQTELGGSGRA